MNNILPQMTVDKKATIKYLCALLCIIFPAIASAQRVEYTYDNAGNRTTKKVITRATRGFNSSSLSPDDESNDLDSEVSLSLSDDVLILFVPNFDKSTACDVQLCTVDGKVIRKVHVNSPVTKLTTSIDAKGVYLVTVTLNEKKQTWKFVKE